MSLDPLLRTYMHIASAHAQILHKQLEQANKDAVDASIHFQMCSQNYIESLLECPAALLSR